MLACVDTAENEPLKAWRKLSSFSHSPPQDREAREEARGDRGARDDDDERSLADRAAPCEDLPAAASWVRCAIDGGDPRVEVVLQRVDEVYAAVAATALLALGAVERVIGWENFLILFPSFDSVPTTPDEAAVWVDREQLARSVEVMQQR